MTNKTFTKKVVKNCEKPQNPRKNYTVIKHFQPTIIPHSNYYAKIPIVNVESDEEIDRPQKSSNYLKKSNKKRTIISSIISKSTDNTINAQNQLKTNLKNGKNKLHQDFKSTSSSSVESNNNREKFTNKLKCKPKPVNNLRANRVQSSYSAREKSKSRSTSSSLKSITDPALARKELNIKAIKQEIFDNKSRVSRVVMKPKSPYKNKYYIDNIQEEIKKSKNNDIMNKKILITELRSEIAHYKQFSNFQVYHTYEGNNCNEKNCKECGNQQQNSRKSSIEEEQRKDSSDSRTGNETNEEADAEIGESRTAIGEENKKMCRNKGCYEEDSMDDDSNAIRNKIEEANELINRVKQVLGKIKAAKPCPFLLPLAQKNSFTESNTTADEDDDDDDRIDDEEIVQDLKNNKETEGLVQGSDKSMKKISTICPQSFTKNAENETNILNTAFIAEPSGSQEYDDELMESENRNTMENNIENVSANKLDIFDKNYPSYCNNNNNNNNFPRIVLQAELIDDRPKTRRKETEDDLSELRNDKFRSSPEMRSAEVTSSFEELHEKLQTISETTESTSSSPRISKPIEKCSQTCNTESDNNIIPKLDVKVQAIIIPERKTIGINCCPVIAANKVDKASQVEKVETKNEETATEHVLLMKPELEMKNFDAEQISKAKKCGSCQAEFLPIIQIMSPSSPNYLCHKCKMVLKQEHFTGKCVINSTLNNKMNKLKIQVLPPVIIKPALILRQVLNFSIEPDGRNNENRVKNTENVVFEDLVFESPISVETVLAPQYLHEELLTEEEEDEVEQSLEDKLAENRRWVKEDFKVWQPAQDTLKDNQKKSDYILPDYSEDNNVIESDASSESSAKTKSTEDDKSKRTSGSEDSRKKSSNSGASKKYTIQNADDVVQALNSKILSQTEKDELRKRLLVYKSYNIYDNPNKHDPAPLDKKSLDRFSTMDFQFYKTFVNPEPTISQELFTPNSPSQQRLMGYESKTIQCDQSMIMKAQADEPKMKKPSEKKLNFSLINKPLHHSAEDEKPFKDAPKEDLESQPEISKAKTLPINVLHSDYVMHGSAYSISSSDSTPSEITVTVSYSSSSSSDASRQHDWSKSCGSQVQEIELKSINLDDVMPKTEKIITVKDTATIKMLKEKLKTVDVEASLPALTLKNDSENKEAIDKFLGGLTRVELSSTSTTEDKLTSAKKNDASKSRTINYLFNDHDIPNLDVNPCGIEHLELGKNGRYKDEENLFTQIPHATASLSSNTNTDKIIPDHSRRGFCHHPDLEVRIDKFQMMPKNLLRRYSPDASNSDTVTTNSLSEGEIFCKHSLSNGEIHRCRNNNKDYLKSIIQNHKKTWNCRSPHSLPHSLPPKNNKFDINNDPTVFIEERRNYFNNWVTYLVKPQDNNMQESTTTSTCSNK